VVGRYSGTTILTVGNGCAPDFIELGDRDSVGRHQHARGRQSGPSDRDAVGQCTPGEQVQEQPAGLPEDTEQRQEAGDPAGGVAEPALGEQLQRDQREHAGMGVPGTEEPRRDSVSVPLPSRLSREYPPYMTVGRETTAITVKSRVGPERGVMPVL
jgi:hypothetical protein